MRTLSVEVIPGLGKTFAFRVFRDVMGIGRLDREIDIPCGE